MGLLDYGLDPRTQGLLSAALQGLQASGPSRMPVSLGQIIGQGGAAGLNEYQRAIKEQRAQAQAQQLIELEKQRAELTKAQIDKMKAETTMLSGLGGLDMSNPDQLEAAASKLMMVSPDKANSLMIRAKDLRATQQEDQTLKALRPTQGLISDVPTQGVIGGVPATRFNVPQGDPMVQPPGATEPIPASVAGMGKTPFVANPTQTSQLIPSPLMGGLLSSQAPGVPQSAGGLTQMMANPAFRPKSSLIEAQIEKLRNADTMAQERSIARDEGKQTRLDVVDAIAANRQPASPHVIQTDQGPSTLGPGNVVQPIFNEKGERVKGPTTSTSVVPEEHSTLHGAEYLQTLPQGTQNSVKGLADGTIPLTSFSIRNNERGKMIERAKQYDPTFDAGIAPARVATRKDFTSGMAARNVTAINTAIAHMGSMNELADALENKQVPAANAVLNFIKTQTGNPSVNNFDTAKQAVATELMRVFRQVNASENEMKDWEKRFLTSGSPEQIKGALKVGATLLKGRIDAMNDQWDRGMNTTGGYPQLLAPRSKAAMASIGVPVDQNSYVEIRKTKDGKTLGKKADGTIEEVK